MEKENLQCKIKIYRFLEFKKIKIYLRSKILVEKNKLKILIKNKNGNDYFYINQNMNIYKIL